MGSQGALCIMGPLWGGKVMTDIFGIQNIVLNWTFSLVSELLYTGMFLSSQNQHSFLYPFIMLELQNFFPRCLDLIKLEHLMTTRYTYKCNNCTLYLYLYYQALCLYCFRYITTYVKRTKEDLICFSNFNDFTTIIIGNLL